jgi:hypothetical protein
MSIKNLFCLSILFFSFVNGQFVKQSNLIISSNISGNHELSVLNVKEEAKANMGFSGSLEGDFYKVDNISIGIGTEFMLLRELEENIGSVRFTNSFFGTLKVLMSSSESSKVYAKARLGYATPKGDKDYEGDDMVTYGGGMSYGFGGEIYFSSNNFLEILFLNYSGDASLYDYDYGNFDFDIKHTHINIGFGISL